MMADVALLEYNGIIEKFSFYDVIFDFAFKITGQESKFQEYHNYIITRLADDEKT